MKKTPIDIETLRGRQNPSLAEACRDYLYLEHKTSEKQTEQHMLQHLEQRLQTGESVLVQITDVHESESGEITVTANVDYRKLPYKHPERVLNSLRHKESEHSSTGEFVMGIPINKRGEPVVDQSMYNMHEFPRFIIESIDNENTSINATRTITMSVLLGQNNNTEFIYRQPWVSIQNKNTTVSSGDLFILDEAPDNYTAESARKVLRNDEFNTMTSLIESITNDTHINDTGRFDTDADTRLVEWMGQTTAEGIHKPNKRQQEFIYDVANEVSLLQGPPGTGKTSGAIAPAILTRLTSYTGTGPCRVLVTGPSNKSINEVMNEVLKIAKTATKSDETQLSFDNTLFIRLSDDPEIEYGADWKNIIYTPVRQGDKLDKLLPQIQSRLQSSQFTPSSTEHIVVFGTSRRTWKLAKQVIDTFAFETDTGEQTTDSISEDTRTGDHQLFDVVVTDEASMMTLPDFLTATAFYAPNGNVLIAGDHRQLSPVQQHTWDTEYKPSILRRVPFLSVLNYFRYLRGDVPERLNTTQKKIVQSPAVHEQIPLHQLKETYRCHTEMAAFLRKWVYGKLDDLPYTSNNTATIQTPQNASESIQSILHGNHPITVVTYPEGTAQESNAFEAQLTKEIIAAIEKPSTVGVVTPHNAQRGRINTALETVPLCETNYNAEATASNKTLADIVDTDTVERFQGGTRETMIMNGTVSDPDYIDSESDFLLNLNRLNVSLSRMQSKCIVIASEAIFNHIPLEMDEYNNTLLWKGLAKESGLSGSQQPDWHGQISTAFPNISFDSTAPNEISVYQLDSFSD